MRILHTVEFFHPSVGGAQEVVKQVSEQLVKRGHDVTVATTKLPDRTQSHLNGARIVDFAISGNAARGFTGDTAAYQEFLISGRFDIMMNYAAQQWATDLALPILSKLKYRKILTPCGFSGLYASPYRSYFAQMPDIMMEYDHLLFHSDTYRDIEFARSHGIKHHSIIPNGALGAEFEPPDPTFRSRYSIPEDVPLLLTVGSHTGVKGHKLVMQAFRRARIGRAILVVIGNAVPGGGCLNECRRRAWIANTISLGRKRVILLDPPRADVVAAHQAADLFLLGSNVECSPLVLFEAMASKTAFVTLACGNAEEIVTWGGGGIILPTETGADGMVTGHPRVMARAIENLVHNYQLRQRLAESGYRTWKARFTWEAIGGQYEALYHRVLTGDSHADATAKA